MRTLLVCLVVLGFTGATRGAGLTWKAGTARVLITPQKQVWLSGYSGKRVPTGKLHDLWVKVLALEDSEGRRAVLVTSDLIGFSKAAYDDLCGRLEKKHGLGRAQVMLTFSHTHSGPVLRESLIDYFPLDDEARKLVADYSRTLEDALVDAVGKALADLKPAKVFMGQGQATFAVNRRANKEADVAAMMARGDKLKGPVDHSVPVLVVRGADDTPRAIVFGYACHATTLSGLQWCGDYPGYAQVAVEKAFPGAQAMFWVGCGADQNPLPRRKVELCEQYGQRLADGVTTALKKPLTELLPTLRTAHTFVRLPYEKTVTDQTLKNEAGKEGLRGRWAQRLLDRRTAKEPLALADGYDYPVQAWRLGEKHLWLSLAGEVVVDYALRFRRAYGETTWVTAYVNDLVCYVPSRRVWDEGGYEGNGVYEYGLPAERWAGDVEERIARVVEGLVKEVRGKEKPLLRPDREPDAPARDNPGPSLARRANDRAGTLQRP